MAGGVSPPTGVVPGAGWSFGLGAGGFVAEGLAVEVSAVTEVVPGSDCADQHLAQARLVEQTPIPPAPPLGKRSEQSSCAHLQHKSILAALSQAGQRRTCGPSCLVASFDAKIRSLAQIEASFDPIADSLPWSPIRANRRIVLRRSSRRTRSVSRGKSDWMSNIEQKWLWVRTRINLIAICDGMVVCVGGCVLSAALYDIALTN